MFFTSDLHLGHERIIQLCDRPFRSVDDMNESIIGRWNALVRRPDTVFVLGDFALGSLAATLPLARRLNGRKKLVPGNHDRCWRGHRKVRPADYQRYVDVGFEILPEQTFHRGLGAHLSHFPVQGDSQGEDRFAGWRPAVNTGEWLIHGHVHGSWVQRGRQINVGQDVWRYAPVPYETLQVMISHGPQDLDWGSGRYAMTVVRPPAWLDTTRVPPGKTAR